MGGVVFHMLRSEHMPVVVCLGERISLTMSVARIIISPNERAGKSDPKRSPGVGPAAEIGAEEERAGVDRHRVHS